ncbi:MFS transporter [Lysinibacillus macroides]|uniref:MFS transporter n=1 Tax=Lysinibacillus macroides TaxID=33935 RepID=UPI0006B4BEAA|nr:MFS transporter [Lysinibacillus macroides]QPR69379.1 MFS transporter [Lysinibacillus macroides]
MNVYVIVFLTLLFQISLKGNIMLVTLTGLHLEASPTILGILLALGSLFPMLLASYAGRLSDRIAINYLLAIGMIGAALSLFVPYFFHNHLYVLLAVQLSFGLFQILTVVSSQNLIGTVSTSATRAKNYGIYTLSVSIANLIGPLIVGGAIDFFHYRIAYMVLGIFAVIPGVFFLFIPIRKKKATLKESVEERSFLQLLFHPQLKQVFITSGVILTGVGLFEFYFPIYTDSLGLSASIIGVLVSINACAFILSRLLMHVLQRKFTSAQIIGGCLLIAGATFFFMPFVTTVPLLALLSFIMGLGLGCCQPLSIVMAYDHSPAGHTGEVLGIRLTVNKAVQFTVPILFGSISFLGFFPIFWFNTILFVLSGRSLLQPLKKSKT